MNRLVPLLVLVLSATSAAAEPISIDYQAADPSCIDAGRFADEVSAKLGFVPWTANAPSTIRVRITHEGAVFSGSVKNVDGSAKIIDGATCAEVTSNLAVTVAAAVDRRPAPTEPATPPAAVPPVAAESPPSDDLIQVEFASSDGRRVDITIESGGGVGTASNGKQIVTSLFAPVCTTPCDARLTRGRHYLRFSDPDAGAFDSERFLLDEPTTITVTQKSRRGARAGAFVVGLVMGGLSIGSFAYWDNGANVGIGIATGSIAALAFVASAYIKDAYTTSVQSGSR